MLNKYIFLTFGNELYYNSLNRIKKEAFEFNIFDKILIYNDINLREDNPDFWIKHKNFIMNNRRGYGYWLWKSYLVLKTLETMDENDILIYCDAGCTLNKYGINRLKEYFEIVKNSEYGILSFELIHLEKTWTKMDLFEYLELNNNNILNSNQLMATSFILRKCNNTINLVNEWYKVMTSNYNLIDDSPSLLNNDISFIEHRHDQSVFSLLRKKYGTEIISDETWYPDFNNENIKKYPILAKRIK